MRPVSVYDAARMGFLMRPVSVFDATRMGL
jgi:hypothetical protein